MKRPANIAEDHQVEGADDDKKLLLQLKRPHYDAIKERRKIWEARPMFHDDTKGGNRHHIDKLASVGRTVVLQSGARTNDRVSIAEVRRYTPDNCSSPLRDMVEELGAELLPDDADASVRERVYTNLYGSVRCSKGLVAMRLEWP